MYDEVRHIVPEFQQDMIMYPYVQKVKDYLAKFNAKKLQKDPIYNLMNEFINIYIQQISGGQNQIAQEKAKSSALGRKESKAYEDMINGGRIAYLSVPVLQGMLEGGVPIMKDGACLGAVGVSGVKSTEDAQIAKAGIAAIGL